MAGRPPDRSRAPAHPTERVYWGFHRLSATWASRVVQGSGVGRGDLVLDIGAGTGILTAALSATGATVVAVELHRGRARFLRTRFAGEGVVVVEADAADLRLPRRPFRVVANPPFSVSRAVLGRLVAPGSRMLSADLVLPLHVANRWAGAKAPGVKRWGAAFDARVLKGLPARALVPPARAPIALLHIERSGDGFQQNRRS